MFIRPGAVVLAALGVAIAILSSSIPMVVWWTIAVAALCGLDAALAIPPRQIQVHRNADTTTRLGAELAVRLTLTNRSTRRARGALRDAWTPSAGVSPTRHGFDLPGGERRDVTATMKPTRRGTLRSRFVTIRTWGPMRLAGRQKSFDSPWSVRVLPAFNSRAALPSRMQTLRELDGRSLFLVRGEGTEFDSLRHYVAGDDVRAIDWRSTARVGDTLVRTWLPERDRHVVILLDSGRSGALRFGDAPAFDSYIESALLLATLASKAGDRISVIAADSMTRARVSSDTSAGLLNKISESLADVEPRLATTDWTSLAAEVRGMSAHPALLVVLTHVGTSTVSADFLDTISTWAKRAPTLVASPTSDDLHPDMSTAEGVYEKAAMERARLEKEGLRANLQAAGAHVLMADSNKLPLEVADAYLDLKARGRL